MFCFPRIYSLFKAIQIIIAQRIEFHKKDTRDDTYKLFEQFNSTRKM